MCVRGIARERWNELRHVIKNLKMAEGPECDEWILGGEKNVIIFKTDISFCHRSSQIRACDNNKYVSHRSVDREKGK